MLALHASQKEWLDESQGMDSYLMAMEGASRKVGEMSGRFAYAEGWQRRLHLGFCAEDADPLAEALADLITFPAEHLPGSGRRSATSGKVQGI